MTAYKLSVISELGTLAESVGEWDARNAQKECLALASDTLTIPFLLNCSKGNWERQEDGMIVCDLSIWGRVVHQLWIEPIRTREALETIPLPALT